jgi:hypothetical protein
LVHPEGSKSSAEVVRAGVGVLVADPAVFTHDKLLEHLAVGLDLVLLIQDFAGAEKRC